MLAPHAADRAVTISSLIGSLAMFHICRTIRRHFSPRQVKLCIDQRKYKQKKDRPSSLTKLLFRILQNSRKNVS